LAVDANHLLRTFEEHVVVSPMPTAKQRVRDLLERLPDNCSLDDVVYHLYAMLKVDAGLAEAEAGRLIPHDVVAAELRRKWTVGSER
jgi:hypothetical protein